MNVGCCLGYRVRPGITQKLRQLPVLQHSLNARDAFQARGEGETFARHEQLLAGADGQALQVRQAVQRVDQPSAQRRVGRQALDRVEAGIDPLGFQQWLTQDAPQQAHAHGCAGPIEDAQQRRTTRVTRG
jgi:hypothetical protein